MGVISISRKAPRIVSTGVTSVSRKAPRIVSMGVTSISRKAPRIVSMGVTSVSRKAPKDSLWNKLNQTDPESQFLHHFRHVFCLRDAKLLFLIFIFSYSQATRIP